jgi:hypothetical protein
VIPPLLLAAALAAAPGSAPQAAPALAAAPLRQEEEWDEEEERGSEDRRHPHVHLSVWGGEAVTNGGSGRSSSFASAEAAWLFSQTDVGVALSGYHAFREGAREWTPVYLLRLTQRFRTRRGLEAAFTIGFGAGRPSGWVGWYQIALGMRVPLGPLFLGGELAFEQYDIIRVGGGLGVAF